MKFIKGLIPYAVILLLVVIIRSFIVTPVIVSGTSMYDTLNDGDILLLEKFDKNYERFDIIIFDYNNTKLVKRVIGLPGEHIEYKDGKLYINGNLVDEEFSSITSDFTLEYLGYEIIPEGYYFVLGDNRNLSSDSRVLGLIKSDSINGKAIFSIWPFTKIG